MMIKYLKIFTLYLLIIYISCSSESFPGGKRFYTSNCESCHMEDGSGLPPMYPSLHNSTYLNSNLKELPCIILNGKQSQLIKNIIMPAHDFNDVELTNLINYMNVKWGSNKNILLKDVQNKMKNCK